MYLRSLALSLLIFIFPLFNLGAQSFFSNTMSLLRSLHWSYNGGLLHLAADNGKVGADPAPILPSLGAAAAWHFTGPFWFEATEDIYFTNYEYNYTYGYPMPCNPENRSAFVMGFVTGFQVKAVFPIPIPIGLNPITTRVYAGLVLDLRLVLQAFGLNHPDDFSGGIETNAKLQTDAIRSYFWGSGRMFYSVIGAGADYPVNENFMIGLDLRMWIPLYRIWTNENIPDIDGWRFGASIRLTPRKKS